VQRQLDLAAHIVHHSMHALGDERLQCGISSDDYKTSRKVLQQAGISKGAGFLLLHPVATAASRRVVFFDTPATVTKISMLASLTEPTSRRIKKRMIRGKPIRP
jgi:hypothetical protein